MILLELLVVLFKNNNNIIIIMECLICYNEVELIQFKKCNNCDKLICLNCNSLLNECTFCKIIL